MILAISEGVAYEMPWPSLMEPSSDRLDVQSWLLGRACFRDFLEEFLALPKARTLELDGAVGSGAVMLALRCLRCLRDFGMDRRHGVERRRLVYLPAVPSPQSMFFLALRSALWLAFWDDAAIQRKIAFQKTLDELHYLITELRESDNHWYCISDGWDELERSVEFKNGLPHVEHESSSLRARRNPSPPSPESLGRGGCSVPGKAWSGGRREVSHRKLAAPLVRARRQRQAPRSIHFSTRGQLSSKRSPWLSRLRHDLVLRVLEQGPGLAAAGLGLGRPRDPDLALVAAMPERVFLAAAKHYKVGGSDCMLRTSMTSPTERLRNFAYPDLLVGADLGTKKVLRVLVLDKRSTMTYFHLDVLFTTKYQPC
ncbi:hypothetical protein SELMODRAFT_419223 [Selaginella moellendorffii]|uniref:Uncharacterized protein n=1 Tax=Selaginella moellendorffii TaxID=88036 RepID=D8S886_SELML|nr:hypothetical protein SELMODRAFT_419223 [Selaginella moellendorffii]